MSRIYVWFVHRHRKLVHQFLLRCCCERGHLLGIQGARLLLDLGARHGLTTDILYRIEELTSGIGARPMPFWLQSYQRSSSQ
jgi:hypothetical protein